MATPFCSNNLTEHLVRGGIGLAALALAIWLLPLHPLLALGLGVAMVVAFRGCPLCWTTGLIETIQYRRERRKTTSSGR